MKMRKILSFVLACLMTVSAVIFTASAANEPIYALRANAGTSGFSAEAVTATLGHDTSNDIVYYHYVPKDKNDWMHFAWHDAINKFKMTTPLTLGIVMRANKAGAVPSVRFCDRDGGSLTITKKAPAIKGDGTWEVVWFPAITQADIESVGTPDNTFNGLTHIQGFAIGEALVGKDMLTSGLYFDIAGYAFFNDTPENLKSLDLIKTLGLGDNGKLTFGMTDDGKPVTTAPVVPSTPTPAVSANDVVLDYTKMQRGICDHKDTGVVEVVDDTAAGKAVEFKVNPNAQMQDYLTIDGHGAESFGVDLAKYKYMHIEMKFISSKLQEIKPSMRFLSTTSGNIEGLPYLTATPLKADGKWQTVTVDMSSLSGKYGESSIVKHMQFSVGGREHKAADFGETDIISVSKIVLSNNASFTSSATGTGSTGTKNDGPKFDAEDKVIAYPKMQRGVCDNKDTGVVNATDKEVTFVINNQPENNDYVTIDGYGADSLGIDIAKYKYMVIDMKFESETIDEIYPVMRFLSTTTGGISGNPYIQSVEALPSDGQWHKVVINMYNGLVSTNVIQGDSVVMRHMQFSVGGREYKADNFGAGDKITISNITLTNANPNKDKNFTVSFKNGFSLATGEAPADIVGLPGTKYTLPEIPFTAEGYDAVGWMMGSSSKEVLLPGTEMEIGEQQLTYDVVWKERIEAKDYISIDYASYFNGICDGSDSATAEIISLNGKPVVKVVPNPAMVSNKGEAINLDGWSYGSANLNLNLYKTILVEYLYLSDNPVEGNAKFNIMAKNFTGQVQTVSREPIIEGRWAVASFDMTAAEAKMIPTAEPKIMQAHIYPLGSNSAKKMNANDVIYVGKIIAIPEVSASAVSHESFITGYTDGTFGINGNMTRAEACTIVARLAAAGDANIPTGLTSAFADVPADQWYHKYISYVESLGFLKSYSGNFLPNQNITRAEFVELVYNMGLLSDAGKNGVFTDVAADHPRAAVIAAAGKAGLVNGYANGDGTFCFKPDNTITRAEVVTVINNAYGKKPTADGIFEGAKTKFSDVTPDHWAFAHIIDASVSHISYIDAEGKETWKYVSDQKFSADGFVADFESGAKALAEYTALFDKRAEEIKNTPNMDLSGVTGKKYYVSSSTGDDANDGLSPEKPFKTITAATAKAIKGDAILLKRGDMWRERFKARNVLYTAYGEGPKPVINFNLHGDVADESLWTLVEGTTDIYKYAKEIPDVGNIIVNGNKTLTKHTTALKFDNAMLSGAEIFNVIRHLKDDNHFVSVYAEVNGKSASLDKSTLYVKSSAGNPGKIYDSIEIAYRGSGINAVTGTTMDNIAVFYAGSHGISMGTVANVKFTNMEIGWIGGSAQNTSNGTMTRFGNGIEVYGGCDNFVIDNCYVYQCYDAGITHQKQLGSTDSCTEKNVWFTNNVIDRCIYNIEYFMGKADKEGVTRLMENITYEGNLLARSGFGWGYGPSRAASIKGWDHHNNHAINFNIKNNVFIMDRNNAIDCGYGNVAWMPKLSGNIYIQKLGNTLTKMGANGATQFMMDSTAAQNLENVLGESGAVLYYVDSETVVEEIK